MLLLMTGDGDGVACGSTAPRSATLNNKWYGLAATGGTVKPGEDDDDDDDGGGGGGGGGTDPFTLIEAGSRLATKCTLLVRAYPVVRSPPWP